MMVADLVERETHAIFDLDCWPCHANQHAAAWSLLRSVKPEMLLLWDSDLHSFKMAAKTIARDADFLGRVPTGPQFTPILRSLPDNSFLAYLYPDPDSEQLRLVHGLRIPCPSARIGHDPGAKRAGV